jgi:hypothetical protein
MAARDATIVVATVDRSLCRQSDIPPTSIVNNFINPHDSPGAIRRGRLATRRQGVAHASQEAGPT